MGPPYGAVPRGVVLVVQLVAGSCPASKTLCCWEPGDDLDEAGLESQAGLRDAVIVTVKLEIARSRQRSHKALELVQRCAVRLHGGVQHATRCTEVAGRFCGLEDAQTDTGEHLADLLRGWLSFHMLERMSNGQARKPVVSPEFFGQRLLRLECRKPAGKNIER